VQFKDNTVRQDTFTAGSGFTADYHFMVDSAVANSPDFKVVVEHIALWSVSVNGQEVKPTKGDWYFDKSFSVINISSYIHAGKNTITLTAPRMSVYAEIEPVYILGDFDLAADSVAWKIIPPQEKSKGSWKEQGMPLYGHEMVYNTSFTAPAGRINYWVKPGIWKGTVAVLTVNNKRVAVLIGNEKGIDISQYVKEGNNEVELIITGSLKNTMGPHYYKPQPGLVSPWHWRNIYSPIPGKEYDLYDYGLLGDFHIFNGAQ
jgi:hypothetical protein